MGSNWRCSGPLILRSPHVDRLSKSLLRRPYELEVPSELEAKLTRMAAETGRTAHQVGSISCPARWSTTSGSTARSRRDAPLHAKASSPSTMTLLPAISTRRLFQGCSTDRRRDRGCRCGCDRGGCLARAVEVGLTRSRLKRDLAPFTTVPDQPRPSPVPGQNVWRRRRVRAQFGDKSLLARFV